MKPFVVTATIAIPLDQVAAHFAPAIDARVEARIGEISGKLARRRAHLDSLEAAIGNVVKATNRVENARNTRDETPSINALIAAAVGLRSAREAYRKGS